MAPEDEASEQRGGRLRPRKTVHLAELYPTWFRKRKMAANALKGENYAEASEELSVENIVTPKRKRPNVGGENIVRKGRRGKRRKSARGYLRINSSAFH